MSIPRNHNKIFRALRKLKGYSFNDIAQYLKVHPRTVKRIYHEETAKVDAHLWLNFCRLMGIDPLCGLTGHCRVTPIRSSEIINFFSKGVLPKNLTATVFLALPHIRFISKKMGFHEANKVISYYLQIDPDYFSFINAPLPQYATARLLKLIAQMGWEDEFWDHGHKVISERENRKFLVPNRPPLSTLEDLVKISPTITRGFEFSIVKKEKDTIEVECKLASSLIATIKDEMMPDYFIDKLHRQNFNFYQNAIDFDSSLMSFDLSMHKKDLSILTFTKL